MFPERPVVKKEPDLPPGQIFYRGHKAVCGIQLVVDGIWRYQLQEGEQLTVEIRDESNTAVITKTFGASDIDTKDKIATAEFSESETSTLNADNKYFITAFVDGYVVLPAKPIYVKEVVQNERTH